MSAELSIALTIIIYSIFMAVLWYHAGYKDGSRKQGDKP